MCEINKCIVDLSQRDEHRAEELVGGFVAVAERVEVVAHVHFVLALGQHFHIGDVVAGARLRHRSAAAFGLDAKHTIFQAATIRVIHQRDLTLVVVGELVVVVPRRHPVGDVLGIAGKPFVPLTVIEQARFAIQRGADFLVIEAHASASACSFFSASRITCTQYSC